jgi:uncharacterized protein YutE (UPF0331/DUF86 family)
MRDDVLLNKAAAIERCVARAKEEYNIDPRSFVSNFSRQDAAILNIQRACEAALDIGQHLIRREQLGVPQSARDVFELLAKSEWIERSLAEALKRMIGFRNMVVFKNLCHSFNINARALRSDTLCPIHLISMKPLKTYRQEKT